MAEEVGFEPTVDFHLRRFSRPVHSTTLPLLRHKFEYLVSYMLSRGLSKKKLPIFQIYSDGEFVIIV